MSLSKWKALRGATATHDMRLVCDDGLHVTAHRCVIALASPVLSQLLYGNMPPPSSDGFAANLQLPGKQSKAVQEFVAWCYTDQIAPSCDPVALLHLSEEWDARFRVDIHHELRIAPVCCGRVCILCFQRRQP